MKMIAGFVLCTAGALFASAVFATDTGGMTCGIGYSGCLETGMSLRNDTYQECMSDSSFNPDPLSCPAWAQGDCKSYHCNNRANTYYNQYETYCQGLYCSGWQDSPILIYRHQRPELTGPEGGVLFDIDGDGELDQISWTHNGSAPFLALDRNGNGVIDDGSELFGTATAQFPALGESRNGFVALRLLDTNNDQQINIADPEFSNLLLWRDQNQNGISEADEITNASSELWSIGTGYVTSRARDRHGNLFRWMGRGEGLNGEHVKATDVVFLRSEQKK